jgi:hypothetical protein
LNGRCRGTKRNGEPLYVVLRVVYDGESRGGGGLS